MAQTAITMAKEKGRPIKLGSVSFVPTPKGTPGTEFESLLRKNGAVGILGADFAATRDLLVDYRAKRVYITRPKGPDDPAPDLRKSLGLRRVGAIPFGDRWTVAVTWSRAASRLAFMLFDTGASNTILSVPNGESPRPPGAESVTIVGGRSLLSGWAERRRLSVAPFEAAFDAEVWFTQSEVDSMLAASTLGDQVLLCFRRNEVWVTPPTAGTSPTRTGGATGNARENLPDLLAPQPRLALSRRTKDMAPPRSHGRCP